MNRPLCYPIHVHLGVSEKHFFKNFLIFVVEKVFIGTPCIISLRQLFGLPSETPRNQLCYVFKKNTLDLLPKLVKK